MNVDGLTETLTLVVLAVVLRATPETDGAHLKESVALPVALLAAKLIVTGFVDQLAFGDDREAKATVA
jgi:hypothetical protein